MMIGTLKSLLVLNLGLYASTYLVNALPAGSLRSTEDILYLAAVASTCISVMLIIFVNIRRPRKTLSAGWYPVAALAALLAFTSPGYLDSRDRRQYANTLEHMRNVERSIGDYWMENGTLPESLDELEVIGGNSVLDDPYDPNSGVFHWIPRSATEGVLISVGPDRVLNPVGEAEWVVYDTTNGTVSPGDIVRTIR